MLADEELRDQERPVLFVWGREDVFGGPEIGKRASEICLSDMVEWSSRDSEAQAPGPRAWCVCGEKVTIADAREVTLPNGRPGWKGRCPECGAPLFAIRRKAAGG